MIILRIVWRICLWTGVVIVAALAAVLRGAIVSNR